MGELAGEMTGAANLTGTGETRLRGARAYRSKLSIRMDQQHRRR